MSWTPSRAIGTLVLVGVTAGSALALSSIRVDPPPTDSAPSTTSAPEPGVGDGSTTTVPPSTTSSTTTTTEPPLNRPIRLLPSSRFDLRGVGPVEAGMTVHQAEQASGRRFRLTPIASSGGRCSSAAPDGLAGLTFVVAASGGASSTDPKAGTVASATATDPAFATVSDARVGATVAQIRSIYAGRFDEVRLGQAGVALTIRGRSGADRESGVRIESTDGQRVTSISAGRLSALRAPDGCP